MVVVNTQFYVQYPLYLRGIDLHTRMYSRRLSLLLHKEMDMMNAI